jgi:Protein of unknown function (DUF3142)
MRLAGLPLLLMASVVLSSCVDSLRSQPPPQRWTAGFWYWNDNSAKSAPSGYTAEVIYVHAGTIRKQGGGYSQMSWLVFGSLPDSLPAAREYWLVLRYEAQGVPDLSAAPFIVRQIRQLQNDARQRRLNVVGIQFDIDSPTGALSRYATLLAEVRKGMPAGLQLSITALLDWFRDGTSIADVIQATDEFVPQFYDVAPSPFYGAGGAIAADFDGAEWAPKFNRFGKRFRIGISAFGRARFVSKADPSQPGSQRLFGDVTPLDVALHPGFNLQTSHNDRATRKTQISYNNFQPGDMIQFILPTADAIRAAVEGARRIHGFCAGVVFFRWPGSNENLIMPPDDIMSAAGLAHRKENEARIEQVDGHCAAVSCVDLYLANATAYSPRTLRYEVRSSAELEYFLPAENIPVRMSGPSALELPLPPYCGVRRLFLGRAVSAAPVTFAVEVAR